MVKLYSELAAVIQARANCMLADTPSKIEWRERWTDRINELAKLLPSGSGFDEGTTVDVDASHGEKLVLHTAFHHMNDSGFMEWTRHTVTVTPSFSGINIRISGRNRNDIKEYMYDTFHQDLTQDVSPLKLDWTL